MRYLVNTVYKVRFYNRPQLTNKTALVLSHFYIGKTSLRKCALSCFYVWTEGIRINGKMTFLPLHPLLSFLFLTVMFGESFRNDNRSSSVQESMYDIRNTGKFVLLSFSTRTEKCRFCTKKTRLFRNSLWPSNPGERDAQDSFHEQS